MFCNNGPGFCIKDNKLFLSVTEIGHAPLWQAPALLANVILGVKSLVISLLQYNLLETLIN